jgi:hypothetical protein
LNGSSEVLMSAVQNQARPAASSRPPRRARGGAVNPLGREVILQHCAVAGFRHHQAPWLWPALRRREPLTLRREPDNPHDPDAVALYWRGEKLGYLPRGENLVAARLLDHRRNLGARVEALRADAEGNQRIRVAVFMY